jgi:hypothetical protein
MADQAVSTQIYLSRDQVRNQMIEYIKSYLDIENVDLAKSSFLSYIINIFSTLTSNLLFYETSLYREFFLTQAQLPESIINLSTFLGYNTREASFAVADVMMTFPLTFDPPNARFQIPNEYTFFAGSTEFKTYYETTINVYENSTVVVNAYDSNSGVKITIPVHVDTTAENAFTIILPTRQYSILRNEYQIDQDLKPYQFYELSVPITGKVSKQDVFVYPSESSPPDVLNEDLYKWDECSSLFLLAPHEKGYVSRRTATGRTISFGNNLVGAQPDPGSKAVVIVYMTAGANGNVIRGAINKGDSLYLDSPTEGLQVIEFTCTNPVPAVNGKDEESIEEIRRNSIANLVAMNRLVSEPDFENISVVMPEAPIEPNTIPVLKRSDLKCNEVQIFTILNYQPQDDSTSSISIVPTKNLFYDVQPPDRIYIPKYSQLPDPIKILPTDPDIYFTTLFDMYIDRLNGSASYYYVVSDVIIDPVLNVTYKGCEDYDKIEINELEVMDSSSSAIFYLYYNRGKDYPEGDPLATCEMMVQDLTGTTTYSMYNNTYQNRFELTISPYTLFPEGLTTCYFRISSLHNGEYQYISKYEAKILFRDNLEEFMMSNVVESYDSTSDSTSVIIYDIPVVLSSWYESLSLSDKQIFESLCIQKLITGMDFKSHRMLTDFINLKFTNTSGLITNMLKNPLTRFGVVAISNSPPENPIRGQTYIVGPDPSGLFIGYKNYYATWISSVREWQFNQPTVNDIISLTSDPDHIKYLFTGTDWIIPSHYTIPLKLEYQLFKRSDYFGSDTKLVNTVKKALMDTFASKFGINKSIARSEIISCIQGVDGIEKCTLTSPESDIFFDFDISKFSQKDLLEYSPEYIYFTEEFMVVRIA